MCGGEGGWLREEKATGRRVRHALMRMARKVEGREKKESRNGGRVGGVGIESEK